jgi:hypothetical protein
MYIKIIDETHEWFNQYFMIEELHILMQFEVPKNVIAFGNHEKKRAYWKWKRFKTTYLMHKEIEGSTFVIDKFGTPNINYKDYSICFFNDTRKWGIFINNTKINLINESDLRQWLTTI